MTKFILAIILSAGMNSIALAQSVTDSAYTENSIMLQTATGNIYGTLTLPKTKNPVPVALIIAGSGPTDRNGNNPMMKNESLRLLAYGLAENQIASLRFDKRGIAESKEAAKEEADVRFEDFINDAKQWITLLKKDKRFSKVFVIGHSEGSLIGMIAARNEADGFISIAGAGKVANEILKEQLAKQPPVVKEASYPIIDSLVMGHQVKNVNPMLFALFRPSIQPYLISWFKYNPQNEIKQLSIPILILQGTNDLQVSTGDAQLLANANTKAKLVLIDSMNHVLKIVDGDTNVNIATYSNPALHIATELIEQIVIFIGTSSTIK